MPRFISKTLRVQRSFFKNGNPISLPASGSRKRKREEKTKGKSRGGKAERSHGAAVPRNVVRINSN